MLASGDATPVIAGLAVGITFVAAFAFLSQSNLQTYSRAWLLSADAALDSTMCKTDISDLDIEFQVKQPDIATLSSGYSLRAIEDILDTVVALYYVDHDISCPNLGIDDQLQQG